MSRTLPSLPSLRSLPSLAFLDWGIGGFGVVRELVAARADASYTYLSDSGFFPYGTVPRRALASRLEAVLSFLAARGVRRVVVACNAASTALPDATIPSGLVVTDVIGAGTRLVRASRVATVGLVGGRRTVRARAHANVLRSHGITVVARIAQPLSAFVEAGELTSPRVREAVAKIVAPLRGLPALLLACTHYPALLPLFREALPHTKLLDPAALTLREALGGSRPEAGHVVVMTTGDTIATRRGAKLAFGLAVPRVTPIALDLGVAK